MYSSGVSDNNTVMAMRNLNGFACKVTEIQANKALIIIHASCKQPVSFLQIVHEDIENCPRRARNHKKTPISSGNATSGGDSDRPAGL